MPKKQTKYDINSHTPIITAIFHWHIFIVTNVDSEWYINEWICTKTKSSMGLFDAKNMQSNTYRYRYFWEYCVNINSANFSNTSVIGRRNTVYPKKYAHGFCFAVLCCGYTLTDFPTSIRLTSLALWQSNVCPSASKATLMNMDKYFMWINYERLHNHNKEKHNKIMCIFLGICCTCTWRNLVISLKP